MSVIVKGVSMPAKCDDCPFLCNSGGMWESGEDYCTAIPEQHNTPKAGLPDWCPLVALPEKHGRLIDAEEMEALLRAYADDVGPQRGEYALANGILKAVSRLRDVSTIIEAEGGGENG